MFHILLTIGAIQVLGILVNIVRTKVVAVLVGPEGVGVISIVDQVVQLVAHLSVLSLPFAGVKFLSKAHSEGYEAFRKSYAAFLKGLLMLSSLGTAIAVAVAVIRIDLLGPEIAQYRPLLILALLSIPTMVLGGFFGNVLASAQRFKVSASLSVITTAVLTVATCIGILLGGLPGLYLSTMVAGVLATAGILIYLGKVLKLPLFEPTVGIIREFRRMPNVISFSTLFYVTTLTYTLSLFIARFSVLRNFGEAETGFLQAGMALGLVINLLLNPLNGLFLTPTVNRAGSKEDKFQIALEFQKQLVIILSCIALPIVLFPHFVLTLLFSPLFTVAAQYVFMFVTWQCLAQLTGVYQALLIGLDDIMAYAVLTSIGHLAAGALAWFLVPQYGPLGIGIGFVISILFLFAITLIRLRTAHGFLLPGSLVWLMGYSLLVIGVIGAVFSRSEDWDVGTIFLKIGIASVFLTSLLFFLTKKERSSLYGLWQKLGHGQLWSPS